MSMDTAVTRRLVAALALAAGVAAVFAPLAGAEFITVDDHLYVADNPAVGAGLTLEGVRWAFTNTDVSNWHPLAWLSHMLDVELFGMDAGAHHLASVFIHALSALLLMLVLEGMTGAFWAGAFVAALFAVHPLHVESVAWVSERKDVLSGLFWVLSLGAYLGYLRRPGLWRYLAVLSCFALGLMAKPMLVTLPLVLLLLDWWPLGRLARGGGRRLSLLLLEKAPLLALSAAASILTLRAQKAGGALITLKELSLWERLANSLASYVIYLWKTAWPAGLSVYYLRPAARPAWQAAGAALLLAALTILALRNRRRRPWLAAGWLWYLVTLAPVIGMVQVGTQARADRYTYLPLVGIFIAFAWVLSGSAPRRPRSRLPLAAACAALLLVFASLSRLQAGYWKDDITLFSHALDVDPRNWMAHTSLAMGLSDAGREGEAIPHYEEALRLLPRYPLAEMELGSSLDKEGKSEEAIVHYRKALELQPNAAQPHERLGNLLLRLGRVDEALPHLIDALRLGSGTARENYRVANILFKKGRIAEAEEYYRETVRLDPGLAAGHYNLAVALAARRELPEALAQYLEAARLDPRDADAQNGAGVTLAAMGRLNEAVNHFMAAVRLRPGFADAHYNLGGALAGLGRKEEAALQFREALRIEPDFPEARAGLEAMRAGGAP